MREKDGEEKILNKSKMKVNQAEEKWFSIFFFYSSTTVYSH